MRRIQYIEIHDQSWFPSAIRDEITDALQFGFSIIKAYSPIAPLLQDALNSAKPSAPGQKSIVDLCSGGGGPWFDLAKQIQSRTPDKDPQPLQIWLTDKFPNISGAENVLKSDATLNQIAFYPAAVDAAAVPRELKGFRTMFTSFHHFPPEQALSILQSAVDAEEGIGIFEITRHAPAAIARVFAWTAFLCLATPWVRPFRWTRLLWTYVIPIIPLVLMHDGVVFVPAKLSAIRNAGHRKTIIRERVRLEGGRICRKVLAAAHNLSDWLPAVARMNFTHRNR